MRFKNIHLRLARLSPCFLAFALLIALNTSALAHGKTQQPETPMSEHRQAMLEVKEGIPDEYRIMQRTPILPSEESLQQGQKLFLQNCSVCHGERGDGKGPAAATLKTPPANFLEKMHSAMYGPGEKYWIIGNGSGETGMPAFSQLAPLQRWQLVNYILSIQGEDQSDLEDLFSPN